jgi:hypothetical protein
VSILVLLLAVVVALLGVLVAGLLRSHAEILRGLHQLGVSLDPDEAPAIADADRVRLPETARRAADISGETPTGDAVSIGVVDVSHPTLVAFLTSGCTTCAGFWSAFAQPRLRVPGQARLVAVTKGSEAESPARLSKFAPRDVPVVMSSAAWDEYEVPVAPYFVYVDGPSGAIVGEGAAGTWEQLGGMLEQALEDAGLARRRRRRSRDADRAEDTDAELRRAGIQPGDPSLYQGVDAPRPSGSDATRPQ